jgi:hypothetical protein
MQDEALPKLLFKYKPVGKRNKASQEQMEGSILGRGLKDTGLISLIDKSLRRRRIRRRLKAPTYTHPKFSYSL